MSFFVHGLSAHSRCVHNENTLRRSSTRRSRGTEVLRGEAEQSGIMELDARPPARPSVSVDRNGRASSEVKGNGHTLEGFPQLVGEALRQLNNPSALSRCELVSRLPATLVSRSTPVDAVPVRLTPLEQAQVLRELLVSVIERLRPPSETPRAGEPGALQYHILHEEYVLKRPTRHIMMRHSISESTFHRNRRDAVSALARHLKAQELRAT